jgi:MarR family transcriptional regulator, organic hydroperoxide resistance regulator
VRPQRQGGFLLSRIHQLSGRVFARILREHAIRLDPAEGRILFVLWREGPLPIRDIAQRTSLGKSTLTSLLDRLERAGHVRRVRSGADRRVILIEPGADDAQAQAAFAAASREMIAIFYAGFSDREIDRFEKLLERILANLAREPRRTG